MSAPLDTALSAVTEAGSEPAANDVGIKSADAMLPQERRNFRQAHKVSMYDMARYLGVKASDISHLEDSDPEASNAAIRQAIPDSPYAIATAQLAALQAECARKDALFAESVALLDRCRDCLPSGIYIRLEQQLEEFLHSQALAAQPVEGSSDHG